MRQYELTYLVSDKVAESDLNKITGKVGGFVVDAEGKVLKEEIWKRRKLAYPINKQEFATYVTLNFEVLADKVREIEHDLKITPQIIRHLLILREMGEEKLTLTSDEIVGTEDIEEVIGGEKSFEAVLGETEESRDLMAKREQEEDSSESADQLISKSAKEIAEEPVTGEEPKVKKPRAKKSEEKPEEAETTEVVEVPTVEGGKKPTRKRTKPVVSSEAERLAKLDEELDNLLKDDL